MLELKYVNYKILVGCPEFDFRQIKRFFSSPKSSNRLWGLASYSMGTGFLAWQWSTRGVKLTAHLHLESRLRRNGATTLITDYLVYFYCVSDVTVEKENTLYKPRQICVYAYDIALATKNIQTLKEILSELQSEDRKIGFKINEEKITRMKMFPIQAQINLQDTILYVILNFKELMASYTWGQFWIIEIKYGRTYIPKLWQQITYTQHIINFSGLNPCLDVLN